MGGGRAMANRHEKASYLKYARLEAHRNIIQGTGKPSSSSYLEDLVLHSGASSQRRKVLHGLLCGLRLSRTGFS